MSLEGLLDDVLDRALLRVRSRIRSVKPRVVVWGVKRRFTFSLNRSSPSGARRVKSWMHCRKNQVASRALNRGLPPEPRRLGIMPCLRTVRECHDIAPVPR